MQERAAHVDVALAAGCEQPSAHAVDGDANGSDAHHRRSVHLDRFGEPLNCLPGDAAQDDQQEHSIEQRGNDRRAAQPG